MNFSLHMDFFFPVHISGWYFKANFLYAFPISFKDAPLRSFRTFSALFIWIELDIFNIPSFTYMGSMGKVILPKFKVNHRLNLV